jgi:large subunit ribosomal protein L7/L12
MEKFNEIISQIEKLSVVELNELVKALEEKFGVSAAMMMAPAQGAGAAAAEEKDSFSLHLKSAGANKIAIIKVLKEALGLGLKEAKDLADGAPILLKEGLKKDEADKIKKQIEEGGGEAELK